MTALPNDPEIGWQESLFWWVPIDDTTHMQFSIHRVPVTGEAAARVHQRRQTRRSKIDIAHQDACDQILSGRKRMEDFDRERVDLVRLQDDVAQLGQGIFADRAQERMGRADVGVSMIRRLWRREVGNLAGGAPLKAWKRSETLRPRTWGIPERLGRMAVEAGASPPAKTSEIVDVRPFIEIETQIDALHFSPAKDIRR
jgi:hypothetical protein